VRSAARTTQDSSAGVRIRTYFARLPPESRKALKQLQGTIRAAAPRAVESFSYGIPGFRLDGRPLIWYAAWKHHASLYPMTGNIKRAYASDLERYEMSKGTIRFPLDELLPLSLVRKLVNARAGEVRRANAARKSRPRR
jgi:uncharacterized protein YdhG (YjbR/CyaY superfamily)